MLVGIENSWAALPKFGKWDRGKYTKILSDLLMYSHEAISVTVFVIGLHV